jgi:hypothetical protein
MSAFTGVLPVQRRPLLSLATSRTGDPLTVMRRGIGNAQGMLARRWQWTELTRDHGDLPSRLAQPQAGALVAHALCEISGLSRMRTCIAIRLAPHAIVIAGRNPIELPQDQLAVDDILAFRCSPLDIRPILTWDQGVGPRLTLSLA